ncbi:hypothetical protein EDB83DRAFT_2317441 [Lactarius deliciosus]|nr:hypothetical protein EDB83DRAFT_2317441 [Lactarius deliciosus]
MSLVMSSSLQVSSSSTTNFQPIFEKVLKDYKKKTGTDLAAHPLAAEINGCDSSESILAVLEGKANELSRSRSSDDRLTKWLKPTVNILNALSVTLGEGAGLAFLPTRIIFSGIGILLVAAKSAVTSHDLLVELFDRIESLFRHLETYTEVPPTRAVMDVLVKIMAEVLSILAIATKGVKERRTKSILKKLAGINDIEDALQRFRKLEQGELLTVIAQVLRETKSDAKDGISKETVKKMDACDTSSSLDEGVLSPQEPPAPAPEPSHPGSWRSVHQRDGFTRTGKKPETRPPGPVIETSMWPPPGSPPDRAQATGSWATWQAPEVPPQPRGLFGPRSPRSSNEALSLDELPEPPRLGAWRSVHQRGGFRRTREKPEAWPPGRPAWATWQGKLQAGLEYKSPEGPPQLFRPRSPLSSSEDLPIPFRPSARRPVHQRRVFPRAGKKSEAGPPAELSRVRAAGSWAAWQAQPGEYTPPPPSEPMILAPEFPPQPHGLFRPRSPRSSNESLLLDELPESPRPGARQTVHQSGGFRRTRKKSDAHPRAEPLSRVQAAGSWATWQAPEVPSQPRSLFGPRSPRSSIYEPPAPVYQPRVFRRARKKLDVHTPGGVIETPMGTSPAPPPGRVRRRAVHSGRTI